MKAKNLILLLQDAIERAGGDLEVYHWSGYEPKATRDFVFMFEPVPHPNLVSHYGAVPDRPVVVLDVEDE
jgi:hypothetical protein